MIHESIQIFEEIVCNVVNDVRENHSSEQFKQGLQHYLTMLNPPIQRYQHHQGESISERDLHNRYEYETAILHVITSIFLTHMKCNNIEYKINWPVFEVDSPYNWYTIPVHIEVEVIQLAQRVYETEALEFLILEASDNILHKMSSRYLGEFYTPLVIAEHLIEMSGFEPISLLMGSRLIDPACGGGIILTVIVKRIISYAKVHSWSSLDVLQILYQNIFGFDIQPFAITITKSLLIYSCSSLLPEFQNVSLEKVFPYIQLQDALSTQKYWEKENGFHYILGNPPFMSVKKSSIEYIHQYEPILYGHPNLYQLFIWWSICSAVKNGIICFIVPQSMLAGHYYSNLRKQINLHANIMSITRMTDRTGIFGDADQQAMIFCLQVTNDISTRKNVHIRTVKNANDLLDATSISIPHDKIIKQIETTSIWIVSNKIIDYNICEKVERQCNQLKDYHRFTIGNGGYVWNENKDDLLPIREDNSLPLISAISIRPFTCTVPYIGLHNASTRVFARLRQHVVSLVHSQPALLIQRVTPRKVGRRLVAGIPSQAFYATYPRYFLENHVNYVKLSQGDQHELLYGLMGWLNSDIIQFLFQLRNGTAQVSVFELGVLPASLDLIYHLVPYTEAICTALPQHRPPLIEQLNDIVNDWFGLETRHRTRIAHVLGIQEKVNNHVEQQ